MILAISSLKAVSSIGWCGVCTLRQSSFLGPFPLDCGALWSLFSPLTTTPVSGAGFGRGLRIAPMPSPEALPTGRIGLLDGHLRVTEADGLRFTA